ncbi:hypothetical protein [Vreelandella titanicae]|uniref:hypothetical protein n=1 Tax=Vreelandella titanicae TaxID=664683 RepID=UPI004044D834
MPLSKIERDVLEVIYEEHRQTHRGAKSMIVYVGMNAKTNDQKLHILQALQALCRLGLVARQGGDAWLPTLEGKAALDVSASDTPSWTGFDPAKPGADVTGHFEFDSKKVEQPIPPIKLSSEDLQFVERREFKPEEIKAAQEAAATKWAEDMTRLIMGTDRISDDLLNRCAELAASLLAQAEQAYAAGEPEAWRDLHWLMETGKQLVALRGDS